MTGKAGGRIKNEETNRRVRLLLHSSFFILHSFAAYAADEDEVAKLAPPLSELPPTFWEQHGSAMVLGGLVGATAGAVVVWFLLRPRPEVAVLPAERARQKLAGLQSRPEDGAVVSSVSQILRQYSCAAFGLPSTEQTTTEFTAAIAGNEQVGKELAVALVEFLRRADARKFSTAAVEPLGAVAKALQFVDQAEARLAQLHAAAQASPGEKSRE